MILGKEKIDTDSEKIKEILERGVEEIVIRDDLEKRMRSGEKLRVKHGLDPTGPKIHIGRAVQFWKLRAFQELGHRIVLIIGDFTAQIGDASDKQAMRRPLSEKEARENMKDYLPQIGKILNLKKTEIHYNSQWLAKLSLKDFIKLEMKFTSQQLIHRRNFKERWEQGKEIGLHELSYPLLQGYDSAAIKADVEIGGSDQLFNLLAGRKIQEFYGQKPQDIMTLKMLAGLDGRKMATSWGNVLNITEKPGEMFGKIMSMKDELIMDYFLLAARLSQEEIFKKEARIKARENPRNLKMELAFELVKLYYNQETAKKAQENFIALFQKKEIPEELEKIYLEKPENLAELLLKNNLVSSKSEFRRLIKEKAIEIDSEVINNPGFLVEKTSVIKIGKKRFLKVVFNA